MSADKPILIILTRGNGAGKTTFFYRHLAASGFPFLNAGATAKQRWPDASEDHSYEAARIVEEQRQKALHKGTWQRYWITAWKLLLIENRRLFVIAWRQPGMNPC